MKLEKISIFDNLIAFDSIKYTMKLKKIQAGDTFIALNSLFGQLYYDSGDDCYAKCLMEKMYYMAIDDFHIDEFYMFRYQSIFRTKTLLTEKKYNNILDKQCYALNVFRKHI